MERRPADCEATNEPNDARRGKGGRGAPLTWKVPPKSNDAQAVPLPNSVHSRAQSFAVGTARAARVVAFAMSRRPGVPWLKKWIGSHTVISESAGRWYFGSALVDVCRTATW